MKVATYKGRTLGNSLNVYNYYKQATGHGLQADITLLSRSAVLLERIANDDKTLTDLEIRTAEGIDTYSIIAGLYVALRKGGDVAVRNKSDEVIRDELAIPDLEDGELIAILTDLLTSKKE